MKAIQILGMIFLLYIVYKIMIGIFGGIFTFIGWAIVLMIFLGIVVRLLQLIGKILVFLSGTNNQNSKDSKKSDI